MLFWYTVCEWCVVQLLLFKFLKAQNASKWYQILFADDKYDKMFNKCKFLVKLRHVFNLWKDWHKIGQTSFDIKLLKDWCSKREQSNHAFTEILIRIRKRNSRKTKVLHKFLFWSGWWFPDPFRGKSGILEGK